MERACLLLLFLSLALPAPGQDVLIWKGQSLPILFEQPTSRLDTAFHHRIQDYLCQPDSSGHYGFSFGWYDMEEFQSCWSIENNQLCLDRIGLYEYDGMEERRIWRDSTFLKALFHDFWQDGQIVATWYSGTFKCIPEGTRPIELSDKFFLTWERELVLDFRDGELLSAKWEDHMIHEGTLSLYTWREDSTFIQNWNAFPYERFPALAGCNFRVVMTNAELDDTGRMIDFTPVLRSRRRAILDDDPALEAALFEEIKKRLLLGDWTIYRIGDEYTPGRLDGAVRPIELSFPKE